jgi:hypothetical protein
MREEKSFVLKQMVESMLLSVVTNTGCFYIVRAGGWWGLRKSTDGHTASRPASSRVCHWAVKSSAFVCFLRTMCIIISHLSPYL